MKQRVYFFMLRILALAACLVMLCVFSACSANARTAKEVEKTTFGVDVARYQGTIDWQTLGQSGIDFAIVRLGYRGTSTGQIVEDSNARYNLQEGSAAGIPLGAYFFSTAISVEEAEEEAKWAAALMGKYPITYPVVYDCEGFRDPESRQYHMTNAERTDAALAFLKMIEKLGYEGMFYGSKNELERYWDLERIEKDYKIWVAQYPEQPYPMTPASTYTGIHHMWQYTKDGKALGIDQPVDLNVAYFGYDGIEPAKDKTPAETVGPDAEAMMTFTEANEEVTAKEATNLRNIPSQDADSVVMDVLQNGEIAQRIAISSSGWSKLVFQGNTYYAVSSYLTTVLEEAPEATEGDQDSDGIKTQFSETNQLVTAKEVVNLRKLPSATREDAVVIAQLKHGSIAICTGVSDNGWSRLLYDGEVCYAISSYLMPYSGAAAAGQDDADVGMEFTEVREQVTPKKEANLRSTPSTQNSENIIAKAKNGDVLIRIGVNKKLGWSKVVYNGYTLYCASSLLVEAEE